MKPITLILLVLAILGCKEKASKMNNAVITKPGVYVTEDSRTKITVWIDSDNIFKYSVSRDGSNLITSSENASALQRWSLFYDDKNRLWVNSSDIGLFVWIESGGTYKQSVVTKDSNIASEIPVEVYNNLASSMKKHFR